MNKIRVAYINATGRKEVKRQVLEMCGDVWGSYDAEYRQLEEDANESMMFWYPFSSPSIQVEVSGSQTESGNPEFIRLDLSHFDIKEIDADEE